MLLKRIRFIVIIVSCSLLGIFLLQGYWLYNAYQLSAQQFDKEMAEVMQTLQRKYVLSDMKKMNFPLNSDTGKKIIAREDVRMGEFFQLFNDLSDSVQYRERKKGDETTKKDIRFTIVTRTSEDSLDEKEGKIAQHQHKTVKLLHTNYDQLRFRSAEQRLRNDLDSLTQQLGIRSRYALRLSNVDGSLPSYYSDSLYFHQLPLHLDKVKIGIIHPFYAELSLENSLLFILKKMQWVLIASIFIIGLTSWAFLYMLRTIFQQKKLSAVKNDFFNNMTHEFKTPIATVSLAVEALKKKEVAQNQLRVHEYLEICQHELRRVAAMVDKVLKMAAFEKSEINLSFQNLDMQELIQGVVATMQPQLEKKQADLRISFQGEIPFIEADRDHLANVLYNLIENSLKYTNGTPQIRISCKYEHDKLQMTISDNGIGIPPAYQEKVFANFFRVPTGDIHNVKGFGMGLSYVLAIVKRHGGEIKLKSRVGEGSIFTILLPKEQ